jgi:hypothetical protein
MADADAKARENKATVPSAAERKCHCPIKGMADRKVSFEQGMRSAGGIGQPNRAPRRPRCSLLSGRRVTPSRPLPLRRNAAVTV